MIQVDQYFKQLTFMLLKKEDVKLSIINNILYIKENKNNINIINLLNKNYIEYKIITK
jgi:hypothetical protein